MPRPKYSLPIILIILTLAIQLFCQETGKSPPVFSQTRKQYSFPWAGGMNSSQFGQLDIDRDGIKDLVVFDRVGDRIMPFVVLLSGDSFDYRYAPEYIPRFPQLFHWAVFADYNLDGKEDIFTYSPGYAGMQVYRNTSSDTLSFTLQVYPYLTSYQGGGYVNIFVTYADYPAITDLDGDGDLDILTFWGLGSFVEKHRNMSIEKFGNADSLDFIKTEFCWGFFAESEESNVLTLDTCLRCAESWEHGNGTRNPEPGTRNLNYPRHTGSTFQILDLNNDNLPDLLLGDVDYPNLVALYNGGNNDTARMVSYDWEFPTYNEAAHLFSLPASYYMDVDFDGTKDLLVSPFDPNFFLTNNFHSNWFYHNSGSDNQPAFQLRTESFLQERMIDLGAGAYPVFFDIDGDGLLDLFAGNYGYYDSSYYDQYMILHTIQTGGVAFFKNTGTVSNPVFTFLERDFAGISGLGLMGIAPAFADLDGDGDADMLLGTENGQLVYYENIAGEGNPPEMELSQQNYQGIDVGYYSTPQLFDLDKDGLNDLIIGERGGNLNYYKNYGTGANPVFTLVTDSLGKINVTDHSVSLDGYSVPCFYRDIQGNTTLIVGSEQGELFYYTGIDGNLNGKFTPSDELAGLLGMTTLRQDRGYRTAVTLADLDQDGFPDMVAGNFSGGLEYLGKGNQAQVNFVGNANDIISSSIKIFPSPALNNVTLSATCDDNSCNAHVVIFQSTGKLMDDFKWNMQEDKVLDVRHFPPGLYLIKIEIQYNDVNFKKNILKKLIVL